MNAQTFQNRTSAGQRLAAALMDYANRTNVTVLALPRGGVPVAYEVAKALHAPLDVIVVRKLGVPGYEELAMGAIASGDVAVVHAATVRAMGVTQAELEEVRSAQLQELRRRELRYRGHEGTPEISGRTVILIDDGIATGSTMEAAAEAIRQQRPSRVVIAVPVAAPDTRRRLAPLADQIVTLLVPRDFRAVGQWYQEFPQTSDEEVTALLAAARSEAPLPRDSQA